MSNPASAAPPPPANDNWADATPIASLPFSTVAPGPAPDLSNASIEATDPDPPPCLPLQNSVIGTVWYRYTTGGSVEYVTLQAPVALSDHTHPLVLIAVYTGTPGAFSIVSGGCNSYSDNLLSARIAGLRLAPNTTYSIEVAVVTAGGTGDTLVFTADPAQQYHVTTTADADTGSCGATCSLRDAISASNADPGAVIIPAGTYKLGIRGAYDTLNHTGDLDATQGMGIYGAGMNQTVITADAALDPAFDDRILMLDPTQAGSMAFAVGDLTLTHGTAPPVPFGSFLGYQNSGGGLCAPGGGNNNDDFVGVERIAVTSNTAPQGGGVEWQSPGTIRDSWIAGNTSTGGGNGGGIDASGGRRRLGISGSTISGNIEAGTGTGGGGMYTYGDVSLVDSTVSGNRSRAYGGGIYFYNGAVSVASSTIAYNTAFYDNTAKSGIGAGVYLDNVGAWFANSIVAYNVGGYDDPSNQRDCSHIGGTLTESYNIVQYPSDCGFAVDEQIDPQVLPVLADRGGPTPTLTIDPAGPAHDSGDPGPGGCKDPDGLPLAWDQRGPGFPRIAGSHCDKGAFEWIDLVFRDGFD